jgi:polyhydroxyalkanoate synthesis regulator phasin
MASKMNLSEYTIKEATRSWAEMMKMTEGIQLMYEEEIGRLRRRVTELEAEAKRAQIPKTWIKENLEEAQQVIDNIVGIKGITEDPTKAAIEAGISYADPAPAPVPKKKYEQPRVSISSSIVPSNEELYGY